MLHIQMLEQRKNQIRRKKKDRSQIESKNAEMKQAKRVGKSQIRGLLGMKNTSFIDINSGKCKKDSETNRDKTSRIRTGFASILKIKIELKKAMTLKNHALF
jgi:hypothetical protein